MPFTTIDQYNREQLIRLILSTPTPANMGRRNNKHLMCVTTIADHLIANGVRIHNPVGCAFCIGAEMIDGHFAAHGHATVNHKFTVITEGNVSFCPRCGRSIPDSLKGGESK